MSALPEYRSFNVTVENHIAHLQFSRPEALNSMNKDFWLELPRCLRDIETGTDARVVVISSTGKHFSAGMDLAVFSDPNGVPMGGDPGRMAENLRRVVYWSRCVSRCWRPFRVAVSVARWLWYAQQTAAIALAMRSSPLRKPR